jgi:hypothetical protein
MKKAGRDRLDRKGTHESKKEVKEKAKRPC